MEFVLSAEQIALRDNVRRFCERHDQRASRVGANSQVSEFDQDHWQAIARLGWLGAGLPESVGGSGGGAVEVSIILYELGRHLIPAPYWACALLSGQLLNCCAGDRHKKDLLEPLIDGRLLVGVAHDELEADGRLTYVDLQAVRDGTGYLLNGRKTVVVGGKGLHTFIVSARTSGSAFDPSGISLFQVQRGALGLTCIDCNTLDGRPVCEVALENVRVDGGALIGELGSAGGAISFASDYAIIGLCAEAVGIMERVVWATRDYLRLRRQYGVELSSFQALQHRLSDMFVELELSRSIVFRALAVLDDDDAKVRRSAVLAAKVHVGRSGNFVCRNGIQLHGAMGMVADNMIGQHFKRMLVISGLFGGVEQNLTEYVGLSQ